MTDLSHLLSIIVPTRNEGATIEDLLRSVHRILPAAEVILVDGGTDDTRERVAQLQQGWESLHYVHHQGDRGKGHAIRTGISKARNLFIAQIDGDFQFFPEDLIPMMELLMENRVDMVCGSRFLKASIRHEGSVPMLRPWGNRAVSFYTSLIARKYFSDVLAGIKMWRRDVTCKFSLKSDDFCYEVELPVKALRFGFRVAEFPVKTRARTYGKSSVNVVKTGLRLIKNIPQFHWGQL